MFTLLSLCNREECLSVCVTPMLNFINEHGQELLEQ